MVMVVGRRFKQHTIPFPFLTVDSKVFRSRCCSVESLHLYSFFPNIFRQHGKGKISYLNYQNKREKKDIDHILSNSTAKSSEKDSIKNLTLR